MGTGVKYLFENNGHKCIYWDLYDRIGESRESKFIFPLNTP